MLPNKSKFYGCANCGALSKLHVRELSLVQEFETPFDIIIKPRMEFTFDGIPFTVLSHSRKKVVGSPYLWDEFLLYHPDHPLRSLSMNQGYFHLMEKIDKINAVPGYHMTYENRDYQKFSDDQVETLFVCGELPSGTFKTGTYTEYICPPNVLSRERYDSSIQWWHGRYIDGDDVVRSANEPIAIPRSSGVGAAQPNKYAGSSSAYISNFVLFLVALLIGASYFWKQSQPVGEMIAKAQATKVLSEQDSILGGLLIDSLIAQRSVPSPEYAKSATFNVPSNGTALGINFSSSVLNSWVTVELIIVNETSGKEISTWQDIEYYTGSDEDGAWHEGSQKPQMIISSLDAGNYHVLAKGVQGADKYQQIVSIDFILDPPIKSNFVLFLILGLLVIAINFVLKQNFEHRRWAKSDFGE